MTQYKEKSDKNADLHKNQIKSPFVSSIGKIGGFAHGRIRQEAITSILKDSLHGVVQAKSEGKIS